MGVTLDQRLGTATHTEEITKKTKTIYHATERLAHDTWGLWTETLRTIYKGMMEFMITYGASAWVLWVDRLNKHHTRKITATQRTALIRITKGYIYKTTSNDVLAVLKGIIPIDIKLKEIHSQFHDILIQGSKKELKKKIKSRKHNKMAKQMGKFR